MNFDVMESTGANAISQWEQLRRQWQPGVTYPFLIGERSELDRIHELAAYEKRTPATIIAESLQINITEWVKQCESEQQDAYEEDEEFDEESLLGEWSGEFVPNGDIVIHRDLLTGNLKPQVYLGLIPIDALWMLPAFLRFGNWNACPEAAFHCAIMRYWQQQYGAEIVTMSSDVIECRVQRPPTTKEEAIKLAWEQYWYCEDIVMQGCGDIMSLAAQLLNSHHWFFWWD